MRRIGIAAVSEVSSVHNRNMVTLAYGGGVRGIMSGMGGKSGAVKTHKATPEELAEFRQMVDEHEKKWGKPPKSSWVVYMEPEEGRKRGPGGSGKPLKKAQVLALMEKGRPAADIAAAVGCSDGYARSVIRQELLREASGQMDLFEDDGREGQS